MSRPLVDGDLPDVPSIEDVRGGPVPSSMKLTKEQEAVLQELGRWIREEGLPETQDSHLVKFVHSCDYDLDKSKKCAKDFFNARRDCKDQFSGWDMNLPNMTSIRDVVILAVLPQRTPENFRIIVSSLRTSDTTNYIVPDAFRCMLMLMETLFLTEPTCAGIIGIHDLSNVTFTHFVKVAWNMPRKLNAYLQDGLPMKRECVHLVNCSTFVENGLKMMRHIGRKEDWDRTHVHRGNDYSELHKKIPLHCLPSDYGGTLPCLEDLHDMTMRRLEAFAGIFRSRGLL